MAGGGLIFNAFSRLAASAVGSVTCQTGKEHKPQPGTADDDAPAAALGSSTDDLDD